MCDVEQQLTFNTYEKKKSYKSWIKYLKFKQLHLKVLDKLVKRNMSQVSKSNISYIF